MGQSQTKQKQSSQKTKSMDQNINKEGLEEATLAGGCFWCLEVIFQKLSGVVAVESGYAGGQAVNPTYKEVCTGETGHAEVVKVTFDPKVLSYEELVKTFFGIHDPTTLNRQGNDEGTQYRSAIYYHNEGQKKIAEEVKQNLENMKKFKDPIVTEISPLSNYSKAEDYHQDYFNLNPSNSYCKLVVKTKLDKFLKEYSDHLKN